MEIFPEISLFIKAEESGQGVFKKELFSDSAKSITSPISLAKASHISLDCKGLKIVAFHVPKKKEYRIGFGEHSTVSVQVLRH